MNLALPTHEIATDRVKQGVASPLDMFVWNNEPAGLEDEAAFRGGLQKVIDFVAGADLATMNAALVKAGRELLEAYGSNLAVTSWIRQKEAREAMARLIEQADQP